MKDHQKVLLRRYCRRIGRKLTCRKETKRDLLSGFRAELEEKLPKIVSERQLTETFGTPASVATDLQSSVSEEEVIRVKKHRKTAWFAASLSAVLVCAGAVVWFCKIHVMLPYDEHVTGYYVGRIYEDVTKEDFGDVIWGPDVFND